jgi:hypothetical protein
MLRSRMDFTKKEGHALLSWKNPDSTFGSDYLHLLLPRKVGWFRTTLCYKVHQLQSCDVVPTSVGFGERESRQRKGGQEAATHKNFNAPMIRVDRFP